MQPIPNSASHVCSDSCFFSLKKWPAIGIVLILVIPTCISIVYLYRFMKSHEYASGIWVFIIQQLLFQLIVVVTETFFYFRHMRGMDYTVSPPHHYQLDTMMLIFPLFPLGILCVLRVFPDLIQLMEVYDNHLTSSEPLWVFVNIGLALFNYFQVTFQAIFISEVFCRLEFGGLRKAKYFFLVLACVNFCIWLSWTLECKLITIHGRSFKIFGVVEWIIIVYSTVPFVMFCFAHSTACFLEIMTDCFDDKRRENHQGGAHNEAEVQRLSERVGITEASRSGYQSINDDIL